MRARAQKSIHPRAKSAAGQKGKARRKCAAGIIKPLGGLQTHTHTPGFSIVIPAMRAAGVKNRARIDRAAHAKSALYTAAARLMSAPPGNLHLALAPPARANGIQSSDGRVTRLSLRVQAERLHALAAAFARARRLAERARGSGPPRGLCVWFSGVLFCHFVCTALW